METNVYINGREACSRASDGKSAGAFPDPCWSPPPPPTGPVVVPYSNTAYARDLQNGTATVFICKSMVAQKDRSYFSTSEGNVRKRLVRTVLIFTESSDQLSRATDRVP
ncbi:DUF4150 domain-containing protein, partial [Escherichia coli]